MTGTVTRIILDKGFGFILSGGCEYFFHRSALHGVTFDDLREGCQVTFTEEASQRGPRATNVSIDAQER